MKLKLESKKKIQIFNAIKICLFVLFILVLIYATIRFFPLFKNLATESGRIYFQQKITSLGWQGVLVLLGLMLIQVLLAFLPGEPVELLAGMCYGPIFGTLLIFAGALVSSMLVFFAVRKFGKPFIDGFLGKGKVEKLQNSKWFQNPTKIYIILFLVFFTPGTPKDLFVYIAGLLPVSPIKFFAISTLARFPSVISSTIAGSNIITGNFHLTILTYGISFVISGIIIWFSSRIHKRYIAPDTPEENNKRVLTNNGK